MGKVLRFYMPIAVTLLLLYLVVREVGLDELSRTLRSADPGRVVIATIVAQLIYAPNLMKWRLLLRAQGHEVPLLFLFKLYFIGTFFNNLLPTNVGGDVIRSYELGRRIRDQATGLATVFVERLSGLIVLVAFAIFAFLIQIDKINNPALGLALGSACLALAGLSWLALDPRLLRLIERLLPRPVVPLIAKLHKFQSALHRYRGQWRLLSRVMILSILFYAGAVMYSFVAIAAFHPSIDPIGTILMVPLTMVVAMVPLTFNGIGLQEWSFVVLFPLIGVPPSAALSGMLLIRAITIVSSLVGGVLYLHLRSQSGREAVPVEASAEERAPV